MLAAELATRGPRTGRGRRTRGPRRSSSLSSMAFRRSRVTFVGNDSFTVGSSSSSDQSSGNSSAQCWSTARSMAARIHSTACGPQVATLEDLLAQRVDHLALLVHHLVVLQDVLADLEVAVLDGALGPLDGLGDHLRVDRARRRAGPCPSPSSWRRWRTGASGRPPARGRSGSRRGRPGGRSGPAAGCRCGATRGARCPARRARRGRGPCRPRPCTPARSGRRGPRTASGTPRPSRPRAGRPGRSAPGGPCPRGCRRGGCRRRGRPCWWPR